MTSDGCSYVWHDSFIYVTWLMHMCDICVKWRMTVTDDGWQAYKHTSIPSDGSIQAYKHIKWRMTDDSVFSSINLNLFFKWLSQQQQLPRIQKSPLWVMLRFLRAVQKLSAHNSRVFPRENMVKKRKMRSEKLTLEKLKLTSFWKGTSQFQLLRPHFLEESYVER